MERVEVGNGGWLRYESSDLPVLFLRLVDRGGRLRVDELYLASVGERAVSADVLRRLPLGVVEAWVNGDDDLSRHVRDRLRLPSADLKRLAAHFATTFGSAKSADHWVRASMWAQIKDSGVRQAPALPLTGPEYEREARPPTKKELRLDVPGARPYGDDFFRDVADRYGRATTVRNPAGAIADANGVPVSTVHRWVKVARERGFLSAGQRGKAG